MLPSLILYLLISNMVSLFIIADWWYVFFMAAGNSALVS